MFPLDPRSAKRLSRLVNPWLLGGGRVAEAVELGPEVATPCSYLADKSDVLGLSVLADDPAAGPLDPPPGSHLGGDQRSTRVSITQQDQRTARPTLPLLPLLQTLAWPLKRQRFEAELHSRGGPSFQIGPLESP